MAKPKPHNTNTFAMGNTANSSRFPTEISKCSNAVPNIRSILVISIVVVSSYRGILLQVSPGSWQLPDNCKQQKHLVSWDRLPPCGRWKLVIIFKQKNLSRCPPTTNLFHKSYWRKRKQPNIQNKTIHKRRKPTSTLMPNWESVYLNTIPNQFCTTLQLAKL